MRGSHRLFLCLLLPALAGCADALAQGETNAAAANVMATDDANAMTAMDDAMAVTNASLDANAVDDASYPGSNAAAGDSVEGQVVQLFEGGLGVGAMGLHLAQFYQFGQSRALLMAMMGHMRGQPVRTGRDENCRLGPIDYADFGNVRLNFQQDRFVGWDAAPGGPRLVDNDGLGIGSPRGEIYSYEDDNVYVRRTARGTEFVSGGYHGLLSSARPDARVTDLWAGMICEPR
jgi:hypothetical protein